MTAISIILFLLLMFFWFTYNKSRIAFNRSVIASNAAIDAYKNSMEASDKAIKSKDDLINVIVKGYESIAKICIKQRVELIQLNNPNVKVSQDLFYKMDDIKQKYKDKSIDIFQYFAEINTILDAV